MGEYKEILVKKTPRWIKILIVILIITSVSGWSAYSEQREGIKEKQQQIEDLKWEVNQLQDEIDRNDEDIRLLQDDLQALGWRPVDFSEIEVANRSREFATIAGDSGFWNKRQDVDKYLNTLLSQEGEISEYDIERAFFANGEWNAVDLTKMYWEELKDNEIISVIAVGNLDLHGEAFSESNHSWLLMFYMDYDENGWSKTKPLGLLVFEPTQRYSFVIHIHPDMSLQYKEGYFYTSPFELDAEIVGR